MIKPVLIALLGTALFATTALAADEVIRLSEPVNTTEVYEDFGAVLPESDQVHSLGDAIASLDELNGEPIVLETEITQVCQKKGCFFIARDGEAMARVRFQGYSFFIPTDSAGKVVKLAGTLERVKLSPEQASHYAEDLGEDGAKAQAPDFEYQIMASAVRIPRA